MKRGLLACAVLLTGIVGWAVLTAPPALLDEAELPAISGSTHQWLQARLASENEQFAVTAGAEKRIRWFNGRTDSVTPLSVVYIHGFSATRQEISPVPEQVAQRLGANLYETRLTGHGIQSHPLQNLSAEDLLKDAAESLSIGQAIGEKLVVMGTSTGATLALGLHRFPQAQDIVVYVLLAPNFGPADPASEFLTWPGGLQLARMVIGDEHRWEPANELQKKYWATAYPVEALVEMMRLVKNVRGQLPMQTQAAVLTVFSPLDSVISVQRMHEGLSQIDSPQKLVQALPDPDDPGNPGMHVLAGDIMAPQNNEKVTRMVVDFVLQAEQRKEKPKRIGAVGLQ